MLCLQKIIFLSLVGFQLTCCFLLSHVSLKSAHFLSISFSFLPILLYSALLQMLDESIHLFSESAEFVLLIVLFIVSVLILLYLFTH